MLACYQQDPLELLGTTEVIDVYEMIVRAFQNQKYFAKELVDAFI